MSHVRALLATATVSSRTAASKILSANDRVEIGVTHSDETFAGKTFAGETVAGQTFAGETVSGETVGGETVAGETVAGETVAGDLASAFRSGAHANGIETRVHQRVDVDFIFKSLEVSGARRRGIDDRDLVIARN